MEKGSASRATGATKLNEISSRSHAIFMLIVEKSTIMGPSATQGDGIEQFQGMAPGERGACRADSPTQATMQTRAAVQSNLAPAAQACWGVHRHTQHKLRTEGIMQS